MHIIYFFIRIASWFGHRKAKLLYQGQTQALKTLADSVADGVKKTQSLKQAIWIHVASVGEFEQARPIIEHLKRVRPEQPILLTFYSPSGYELRKNYDKVDYVSYLPMPTRKNARTLLDMIEPSMAIFVKYEFWPAYLKELHKRGIKTYSISAIFRPGQLFFRPWGKPYLKLLQCFTRIYVQDEVSRELLLSHGIQDVRIAGDTRFDRVEQVAAQAKELPVVATFVDRANHPELGEQYKRVIIAGSTWPKDEEMLARYIRSHEDVLLVLVPHEIHEGHMEKIFHIFEGRYIRYTEAVSSPDSCSVPQAANLKHVQVLVIDTMGMLSSIYRYGDVAYIGGGFGVGIHNTLEAAVYGMPVLFGPNYKHFREAIGLINAGAAYSVNDYVEFEARMDEALANHKAMGEKADAFVKAGVGATDHIYNELFAK